jgi:hypothetical protein
LRVTVGENCRARSSLYERAIELEPGYDKPHFPLISVRAALQELELAVALYEQRLAASPARCGSIASLRARTCAHAYERG